MEIVDFNELNAMHKLLNLVKFSGDLEFYELTEIAESPYVTQVFERFNKEYFIKGIEVDLFSKSSNLKFKLGNNFGKIVKRRIKESFIK